MSNSAAFKGLQAAYPVLFFLVFAVIAGIILYTFFRLMRRRRLPLLMVDARVAGKRNETGEGGETLCFVSFVLPNGDTMELQASQGESDMLSEGEEGKVAFRGIKFDSFYEKIDNGPEDK